jgi:hypothetical protein
VDDAVANIDIPEVDFTGYATEEYVAEEIAKIPPTDLTGYATEKYVDEAIAAIPETDFTGYATEDFVTTAVESAKEELSESIVTESDEWKVVDEAGNIIFSVDATGAHTTELTLNGENAATESYVDNAIENIEFPTTDLTNYATKKYVDDAVDGIEIPSLDGYATETYVDNKVADLVNSAPEALNTLGELAEALENHEDAYDALLETVGGKATHTDLENLKEELSESIVSETDEWKIVDNSGNIIFSLDAEGAHTTGLTLDGKKAATEDYVDDAISNIKIPEIPEIDYPDIVIIDDTTINAAEKNLVNVYKDLVVDQTDKHILHEELVTVAKKEYVDEAINALPEWAKEPTKPSYTAGEVHALADTTVLADLAEDTTHRTVTDEEKATWNKKVDSVEGKQLSTNDFTNEYKTKLDNINSGGIVSEEDPTVPAWAKELTKPAYTADEVGALPDTTTLSDLTDNAITEDESKDFIISDS